ncbi:MAG: DUF4350 domain-containing protein [bacterium]
MTIKKSDIKFMAVLGVLLVIATVMILSTPEPVDWSFSFSRDDTIPYGNRILNELLAELFPGQEIRVSERPLYNTLTGTDVESQRHLIRERLQAATPEPPATRSLERPERPAGLAPHSSRQDTNYIIINSAFNPDDLDVRELLHFVARGNSVFIAAHEFSGAFADSMGIETDAEFVVQDSVSLNFVNPALHAADDYVYRKGTADFYFDRFDTASAVVLGMNSELKANFIRCALKEGEVYLHTVPLAFTNYNLLFRNNAEVVFKALSYLPVQATIWDEYYKAGKGLTRTPLRFVLSKRPLKWAYFVAISTLIVFVIFEGKRRQRIIPVVKPLANTTLEFVETVGRLAYQERDHKRMAEKKIAYFLDSIRTRFHVKTSELSEGFCEAVAERSGVAAEQVKKLIGEIQKLQQREQITAAELRHLNDSMERFIR